MTTSLRSPRLLAAAAVSALALFTAACEPDGTAGTSATTAAVASASSAVSTPAAPPSPSAVPSTPPPSAAPVPSSAAPVHSAVPSSAPSSAPVRRTATPAPVQTRTSENPAPQPTTEKAAAGSCAHHTVGSCGWDAGQTPVGSGEMAQCKDGSPSYSASFSGTCSHHGGVLYWFK